MNNPPAFPTPVIVPEGQFTTISNDGMTLRDYFAAAAMQGFLGTYADDAPFPEKIDKLARSFYGMADAMLKAREQ